MLMEPVYEQDFLECSYGFRPERSAHDAIRRLHQGIMRMGGGWVVEIDIRKYFDTVDHAKLREIVRERIRDGEILRLIGKWLNAGVLEEGRKSFPETGTPQGGVISPMLANVYLHKVLDVWFEEEVKPRLNGQAFLVRYADDAVLCFASERDARRVMGVLPKRFEKYGLKLHPDKTRLLRFKPPSPGREERRETFDFLGWTHYWGQTQKGQWVR
jgi:group II intron reverse transcriptase/maturase